MSATRAEYAEQWRAYLHDRAAQMGRTVVDTESGIGDDGRLWCQVTDAATGADLAEFTGDTPAEITRQFGFAGHGEWLTVAQIESALDEMLAEIWPEDGAA
ncbi:hypothetical protein GCM10009613_11570 [Pseudonocardia kongjuensis]|uniref:Uncharacterized protein n=1 Tax=Pseudonocardia kongjuensis TaxID=102227 RepID=A0ABN1XIX7_9PSEU